MSDSRRKKVAYLSDGYTEEFCIPEGDDCPEVKGTFRPPTDMQALTWSTKAEELNDDDKVELMALTCEAIAEHIKSWNILDETGKDVGISVIHVKRLPAKLLERMFKLINRRTLKEIQADIKNS